MGSLPFIGLADRYGRRPMMLGTLALGLALTFVSAASPGYWWFVVIFACGHPMLSSTNALAQVAGAEQTGSVADVGDRFAMAAALTFLPTALVAGLFWLVPETRGMGPEELWPVPSGRADSSCSS